MAPKKNGLYLFNTTSIKIKIYIKMLWKYAIISPQAMRKNKRNFLWSIWASKWKGDLFWVYNVSCFSLISSPVFTIRYIFCTSVDVCQAVGPFPCDITVELISLLFKFLHSRPENFNLFVFLAYNFILLPNTCFKSVDQGVDARKGI